MRRHTHYGGFLLVALTLAMSMVFASPANEDATPAYETALDIDAGITMSPAAAITAAESVIYLRVADYDTRLIVMITELESIEFEATAALFAVIETALADSVTATGAC